MAMANMNLIGVFVTKLWPVQALACGGGGGGGGDGGDGGDGGGGGATKTIISPKFSNFGDIITIPQSYPFSSYIWHCIMGISIPISITQIRDNPYLIMNIQTIFKNLCIPIKYIFKIQLWKLMYSYTHGNLPAPLLAIFFNKCSCASALNTTAL